MIIMRTRTITNYIINWFDCLAWFYSVQFTLFFCFSSLSRIEQFLFRFLLINKYQSIRFYYIYLLARIITIGIFSFHFDSSLFILLRSCFHSLALSQFFPQISFTIKSFKPTLASCSIRMNDVICYVHTFLLCT